MGWSAIILAGGKSARMPGSDKLSEQLGDGSVFDAAISSVPPQAQLIAVGPQRPTARAVTWTREVPPGGGPAVALAAAATIISPGSDIVVTLAADTPFAGSAILRLITAVDKSAAEVAVAVDPGGKQQYLLAAWRASALRDRLRAVSPGTSMRMLFAGANTVTVLVTALESLDCDTADDLEKARTAATALVRVRYYGAAAAAAGCPEEAFCAESMTQLLNQIRIQHGERMAFVLARSSFLIDEVAGRPGDALSSGSVVDVLPPFAGG